MSSIRGSASEIMLLRVGRDDGLLYDTLMFVCFELYDHPDSCRSGCVEGKWIGAQPRVPKSARGGRDRGEDGENGDSYPDVLECDTCAW